MSVVVTDCTALLRRTLVCIVALYCAAALAGCTINIYQSGQSGPVQRVATKLTGLSKQAPAAKNAEGTATNKTGTVSAAEIMDISTTPRGALVRAGDSVALEVKLNVDAYVSCFYQQDNSQIIKLFPNRIIPLYRLNAGQVLRIPGANGFRVATESINGKDAYLCIASNEDAMPNLPLRYQANGFQVLPETHFDQVFSVFEASTADNIIARVLEVPVHNVAQD